MEWDTPIDRMLRERAEKARQKKLASQAQPETMHARDPGESEERIIIMPNPQA